MTAAADMLKARLAGLSPRYGIVLGSGLGSLVEAVADPVRSPIRIFRAFRSAPYRDMPASWLQGKIGGVPVIVLSGRVHFYERGDANAMRTPIETLKALGVETLILTNSAGSLREDLPPGSVMQITDHINFSGTSPLIGVDSDDRFVGLTSAYDPALAERMRAAAIKLDIPLGSGVYMWFSGPNFETPAEIRMARILGADAVGMSTVPEVILARFFGLKVAAASVITNFRRGHDRRRTQPS
ncbi:purine-nucleoside phosphorylase [Rhizobium sp. RCAM05350]|nr:purine-nucleoside phosphorylase [Rhizobium sp. RCAM05350]